MRSIPLESRAGPIPFWVGEEITEREAELIERVLSGREYPLLPEIPGRPCRLIVDVGAHLGAFARSMKQAYPEARLVCFEPSPRNFTLLEHNMAGLPDVTLYNEGLNGVGGEATLYLGAAASGLTDSLHHHVNSGDEAVPVVMRGAAEALSALPAPVSLLKLDTEGCETAILDALAGHLDHIEAIYLEYHHERNRLAIDGLLGERYVLFYARATVPHRGIVCYLRKDLAEQAELNFRGIE